MNQELINSSGQVETFPKSTSVSREDTSCSSPGEYYFLCEDVSVHTSRDASLRYLGTWISEHALLSVRSEASTHAFMNNKLKAFARNTLSAESKVYRKIHCPSKSPESNNKDDPRTSISWMNAMIILVHSCTQISTNNSSSTYFSSTVLWTKPAVTAWVPLHQHSERTCEN